MYICANPLMAWVGEWLVHPSCISIHFSVSFQSIYIYIYKYINMYIYIYIYIYTNINIYIYIYTYVYICRTSFRAYGSITPFHDFSIPVWYASDKILWSSYMDLMAWVSGWLVRSNCIYRYIYIYIHIYMYEYQYIYIYICTGLYIYIYVLLYTYKYICICKCIYICI